MGFTLLGKTIHKGLVGSSRGMTCVICGSTSVAEDEVGLLKGDHLGDVPYHRNQNTNCTYYRVLANTFNHSLMILGKVKQNLDNGA